MESPEPNICVHDEYQEEIQRNRSLSCSLMAGASSPPRQPRQLPWLIFETIINYKKWPKQLGRFQEKKYSYFSTKQKKLLKYTVSFLQNWKNGFIILPSKKDSLNILGLLCRIVEINILIILPSIKISWVFFANQHPRNIWFHGC